MELVRMIHDQTSFTLDLYKQVWQQQQQESKPQGSSTDREEQHNEKNVVLSPLSIAMAMAMAAAGAKGQTLEQLTSVVRLPNGSLMHDFAQQLNSVLLGVARSDPRAPELSLANGVWVEQSLKLRGEYKEIIEKNYGASARPVDFKNKAQESRGLVNSWVAEATKKKIEELLPEGSVDPQTRLILASAIYFKGAWQKQLDPSQTRDGIFHLPSGKTKQVPMMRSSKKHFIKNHGSFKVLRLPYQRGDDPRSFSMYVLLPAELQGLPALVSSLHDAESMGNALAGIHEVEVGDFQLPKFKISLVVQAPALLKRMGLDLAFSPPHADFSGMVEGSPGDDLFISDVFHKAFVEVNEEGTEAAAASAAVVTLRALNVQMEPEDFVADHPFMFLVREDATGVVLFVGHVNDPSV
ncbi:serpin-ZXA [Selaginella moellendorffii]|nr:serpin-ZXA [Selaginella moellendorffii]|eukprot:XP_002983451.2 serpin-ZXA [Selaginella moellendorffii]